jgi:hypothetical protein
MAKSAATAWGRPAPPFEPAVFPPGDWGERIASDGLVVGPTISSRAFVVTGATRLVRNIIANQRTAVLSRSLGAEACEVARLFFENVMVGSMTDWNALYGETSGPDQFDYVSAPVKPAYTLHTRINWLEPSTPMSIADDD